VSPSHLRYEKSGAVATVTLDRPEIGNAISAQMRDELDAVIDELDRDDDVRAVVFTGAGATFCTGYDLTAEAYAHPAPSWHRRRFHLSRERWLRLWRVRQVTVGAVCGNCLAGGTDLLGVLDVVFAAHDCRIGHPQNRLMGMAHTIGLYPLHLGMRRSKEWLFTGDSMTGDEAAELGLVNRAVPAEDVLAVAHCYAERVANVPLDVLASHKDAVHRWFEAMGMAAGIAAAADLDAMDLAGPAMHEFSRRARTDGLRAALDWRDGPFRAHRTYWEAFKASRSGEEQR